MSVRAIALSIAVVLFLANIAAAKDRPTLTALEQLRTELAQLQSDSLLGWPAKVLYENFAVVQNEIDRGNKLLRSNRYRISVISAALNAMQAGDCRGWQEREATVRDALDKNGIRWVGFPDTIIVSLPDTIRAFPLENGELYSFLEKFRVIPVEHFVPGVCRDLSILLDVVRAQQHIVRTAIVLDMHKATRAMIVAQPIYAATVWRVLQSVAPDDIGSYIPVDTGEVFYANPPRTLAPAIPESLARALWGPPIIDAKGLKMYGGIEYTPFMFFNMATPADTTHMRNR